MCKGFSRGPEQITVYRETMSVILSTYISVRSNFRFDFKINILSRYEFKNERLNYFCPINPQPPQLNTVYGGGYRSHGS